MDRLCKTTTFLSTYFHLSLFLVQILTHSPLTYGKSVRIDMRTEPSVHPCLDTFDILMTTPNITEDKYIRLIRVYTSDHMQRYYANTLKLDYVREFKLPLNNYLRLECHLFDANFRYYCFVFVALSRTTSAVLINSRPHCRPTTMEMIEVTSSTPIPIGLEDNKINSLNVDNDYLEPLRPAGPSYKYNNFPTISMSNNIYGNSRRVSTGGRVGSPNEINKFNENLFNEEEMENSGHYINIECKCSNSYDIESNESKVIISLGLIMCDKNNNNFKNNNFENNNNLYDISDRDVGLETTGALQSSDSVLSHSESNLIDKNSVKNSQKNRRYLSDTRDRTDLTSDSTGNSDSAERESDSNYPSILSTICVLNLMESHYKMKVQYENWRTIPVIYFHSTTAHTPHLVVREGRLAIDPQLDINNKSQIHSLRSQYLRIESFYAQNLTLKLILLKTNNKFLYENYSTFRVFLSSLTPIHYTSMALIVLFVICLMALFLISITSPQRKTIVKIVTPSEEGDPTRTSYMEQTDVMSQFSLPDDNQSLEMDYYDYLLPFVPRPQSRATTDLG